MKRFVVDASIAIKWIVPEPGTLEALQFRRRREFLAPDLLIAEGANILWKKVARGNLTREEADVAVQLLEELDVEFFPMRTLLPRAVGLAMDLDHPAYDCFYLSLAEAEGCALITADERLIAKMRTVMPGGLGLNVLTLAEAAAL